LAACKQLPFVINVEPTESTWRHAFVTNATPAFAFSVEIIEAN
jgi:hypothetical protein